MKNNPSSPPLSSCSSQRVRSSVLRSSFMPFLFLVRHFPHPVLRPALVCPGHAPLPSSSVHPVVRRRTMSCFHSVRCVFNYTKSLLICPPLSPICPLTPVPRLPPGVRCAREGRINGILRRLNWVTWFAVPSLSHSKHHPGSFSTVNANPRGG